MQVIAFPSPWLTEQDAAAIIERAVCSGYYSCRGGTSDDGHPTVLLLNRQKQVRGYVTKRHGVYVVLDARGTPVVKSRSLDETLSVFAK